MSDKKRSFFPGIALIGVGIWILIQRYSFFTDDWAKVYPFIMILFGLLLLFDGVYHRHERSLFWSILLISAGLFFFLRNYEYIPYYYSEEYWPLILVAFGFGFLGKFALRPKDWNLLIPASLFILFGIGFSVVSLIDPGWEFEMIFEKYWPIILIIVGAVAVWSGMKKKDEITE